MTDINCILFPMPIVKHLHTKVCFSGRGEVFSFEKHKSSILCFSVQHSLCIMRCLFQWLMIQEEPSILLLLCCTFSPPRPTQQLASLEDSV